MEHLLGLLFQNYDCGTSIQTLIFKGAIRGSREVLIIPDSDRGPPPATAIFQPIKLCDGGRGGWGSRNLHLLGSVCNV